jgi:hypothetical protein
VTLLMIPVAVAAGLSLAGFVLAIVALVSVAGAALAATWRATSAGIVAAPTYSFDGVCIERDALELLADIQDRFEAARATLARVPAAIGWDDVRDDVDVLMWEAVEHAAKLSAVEIELIPLTFAERRTEKSALRRRLFRVRKEHYDHLLGIRHEADALAREAANAVAAAKIALSRTGIVFDVPLVMPTAAGLAARGTLIAARTRLSMLAEAWSEPDETGAMARDTRHPMALNARPNE